MALAWLYSTGLLALNEFRHLFPKVPSQIQSQREPNYIIHSKVHLPCTQPVSDRFLSLFLTENSQYRTVLAGSSPLHTLSPGCLLEPLNPMSRISSCGKQWGGGGRGTYQQQHRLTPDSQNHHWQCSWKLHQPITEML